MSLFLNEERIKFIRLGIQECPKVAGPYVAAKKQKISTRINEIQNILASMKEDDDRYKTLREEQTRLNEELVIYTLDK